MDTREISAVSKDNPTRSTELTYSGLQLELRLKMTSFGWKRKRNLRTSAAAAFGGEKEQEEDEEEAWVADGVDWLTAAKRRRTLLLEDSESKSKRLQEEGALLAENGRYWEAIKYWDEALQLTPDSAVLHEMKAQVLMELGEAFPAVQSAEMAVKLSPSWATGRQTLGRSQLGIGEVHMALRSFEKAAHLDPTNSELWEEDLQWARELVRKKDKMATAGTVRGEEEKGGGEGRRRREEEKGQV